MADARRVAEEAVAAFNAHDERRIRELYADDAIVEAPGDVRIEGPDAATEYVMGWLRAFPDARISVHNRVESGEWVAEEFTFAGTHEETLVGPAGEIPPTHRRVVGRGAEIVRIKNGKVTEDHLYFDQVQVLTQLGLMPEAAATA